MFQVRESKQKGFSLVELGIVFAVAGVALFFTVSKIRETNVTSTAQTVSNDVTQIINNFQRLYSSQAQFPPAGTIANTVLVKNNVFPASWVDSSGNVVSPFEGVFAITVQNWGNRQVAALSLFNVPSKICAELGQLMAGGALGISVNSTDVKSPRSDNSVIELDKLGNECTASETASFNVFFNRGG
jgi:type II secretory pathway pseudopilin PulG